MSRVTQGTVQTLHTALGNVTLQIRPTGNYTLKHGGTAYTVFFRNASSASLYTESDKFLVSNSDPTLVNMLIQAAFHGTCLEITIRDSAREIVGIRISAP